MIMFYQGRQLYDQEKYSETIQLYDELFANYPRSFFAAAGMNIVAHIFENQKEYDKAIKTYRILKDKYKKTVFGQRAVLNIARCLKNNQKIAEAIRECDIFNRTGMLVKCRNFFPLRNRINLRFIPIA